jgi:trk system potassium uptake protein TrkH
MRNGRGAPKHASGGPPHPRWPAAARSLHDRAERSIALLQRALLAWQRLSAPTLFIVSFAALIAIGAGGFLALPGIWHGEPGSFLDALFTATSAVCVTGLSVFDVATRLTFWGQLWLLALIQLGGIGLLTLTTAIIGLMGHHLSLRIERTSVTAVQRDDTRHIWQLARAIITFTLAIEATGAGFLLLVWLPDMPLLEALWHALFHSISAFCNAGFSTFSPNLVGQRPLVLLVVSALIVTGSIGFYIGDELRAWWGSRKGTARRRLSSNSFAGLTVTAGLLLFGTICYTLMEWDGVLRGLTLHDRLVNAWFMSVTARTAGFNSISYAQVGNAAALLTIMLMFVGGCPGSTAGGIKTTTFAVLWAMAWSKIRGLRSIELHGRAIPPSTRDRTVSLTLLAVAVVTAAFFLVNVTCDRAPTLLAHRAEFLPLAFEVISAFATVGLSMDVTPGLPGVTKLIVIFLMFVGRVGLFSFFAAVLIRTRRCTADYRRAQEDVLVG